MKKIMCMAVVFAIITMVTARTNDSIKLSGSLTFLTQTNSVFTGGRFSDKSALRATITASYKDFSFTVMRNSDLMDPKSGANVVALWPAYTKQFDKTSLFLATELDLFDVTKNINLIAPYFVVGYNSSLSVDLMGAYARTFQDGTNIWIARASIGKTFQGYDFRLYGWAVDWNGPMYSLAGEISKKLTKNIKLSVFYHLNNFTNKEKHQEFGAIRVGYSF